MGKAPALVRNKQKVAIGCRYMYNAIVLLNSFKVMIYILVFPRNVAVQSYSYISMHYCRTIEIYSVYILPRLYFDISSCIIHGIMFG